MQLNLPHSTSMQRMQCSSGILHTSWFSLAGRPAQHTSCSLRLTQNLSASRSFHQRPVRHQVTTYAAASSSAGSESTALAPLGVFNNIENAIVATFGSGGPGGDWQEIEGCWVLFPADVQPMAVVHFIGGAFVGAAPQLTYKLFLETLAARGVVVVATPFGTSFDHVRIADETQFKFTRCMSKIGARVDGLPVFGLGHSMGALMHMLICSRYALPRAGNILLSFNNKPATDSIPLLSPFIVPSVKALGPILQMVATNPLASTVTQRATDLLKGFSPSAVRQVMPLVEQLQPVYAQVAAGRQEFVPSPRETAEMIKTYYAVSRNLLVRFADDTLDQTPVLADVLQNGAASSFLDMTIRTLPGDHIRPMQQDIPPEVLKAANTAVEQGSSVLTGLLNMATQAGVPSNIPLENLAKNVSGMVNALGDQLTPNAAANVGALVDDVEAWIRMGRAGLGFNRELADTTSGSSQQQ